MPEPRLTPTQGEILDHLAARHRLGETYFALDARLTTAVSRLEDLGLVDMISGNVEHSIRAMLTPAGVTYAVSPTYESPLEKQLRKVTAQLKEIRELRALEAELGR
jgi:hypothetical protein